MGGVGEEEKEAEEEEEEEEEEEGGIMNINIAFSLTRGGDLAMDKSFVDE